MPDPSEARRRWLGVFCLAIAAGMLFWGQTILEPQLDGLAFLFYWLICFIFTIAAICVALIDIRALRRRTRLEQKELVDRTLDKLGNGERDGSDNAA